MKKFTLSTALAIAALALLSVSCINKDYNTDDAKVTATVEINKTSELAPDELLGFENNEAVTSDTQGDLHYGSSSESVTVPAQPGQPVAIEKELKVDMTTAPDIIKKNSGGTLANPAVKLNITNPLSEPVIFRGNIKVDHSAPLTLPEVEIPANKTVELIYTPDANDPAESADIIAILPVEIKDKLAEGMEDSLTLTDVVLTPKNSPKPAGIQPAEAPGQFSVGLKFVAPLAFVKGSVIKIPMKFTNLGFDLDKYVDGSLEFDVNFSGVNYMPFDVNFTAVSEEANLTGQLNKAIAGATTSEGAPFDAVFVVKKLATKAVINDVTLNLEIKAVKTPAILNVNKLFVITADTVKIIK